jgi:ribosomal protein S18 acetylase RimI-like enzyme
MTTIRPATIQDAERIANVHTETWRSAYRDLLPEPLGELTPEVQRERWEESLSQTKRTGTVVAEAGGEIVGFASFGPEPGNDYHYQGELYAIYVLPAYQQRGIGAQLLAEAARGLLGRGLPNMMAWVLSSNPARAWFEKRGGRFLREREVEFGGTKMWESAYGWDDLGQLAEAH